jgi:hypothetical protein
MGRFNTKDLFPGFQSNPMTENRYSYVTNNPLAGADPSGLSTPVGFLSDVNGVLSDLVGLAQFNNSINTTTQQADTFNQCTLNIGAPGCENIGEQESNLNKSIASLNTQATQTGVNFEIGVSFSPSTYGLQVPAALGTAFGLINQVIGALGGEVGSPVNQAFAPIPTAKASSGK